MKERSFLLRNIPLELSTNWNIVSAACGETKRDFLLKCLEEGVRKFARSREVKEKEREEKKEREEEKSNG